VLRIALDSLCVDFKLINFQIVQFVHKFYSKTACRIN